MTRVDELGVSPAPWRENYLAICDANNHAIVYASVNTLADARLVAAAPCLYEALREAVIELCHDCDAYDREHGGACRKADGSCFVQRWRKAIEKAGGAE